MSFGPPFQDCPSVWKTMKNSDSNRFGVFRTTIGHAWRFMSLQSFSALSDQLSCGKGVFLTLPESEKGNTDVHICASPDQSNGPTAPM